MMRFPEFLVVIILTLIINGCYEALGDKDNLSENQVSWQGILDKAPENPKQNWVYYDSYQEVTFIYNGAIWDTMTVNGLDGQSIYWLGSLDEMPEEAPLNGAFFNTQDSVSYLYTGEGWDTLSVSGEAGLSIKWLGNLPEHPNNPEYNWGYYNTVHQSSYIYNGNDWEIISMDGVNGVSLIWLGSYSTHPADPDESHAYYNSKDKCSYIYNGSSWNVICRDGAKGDAGVSVVWQGTFEENPIDAEKNWAYFNSSDGNSYIYDGVNWHILARSGRDGESLHWQGEFSEAPDSAQLNWAYFNTTDSNSYIYNGNGWDMICKGGADGDKGLDGLDGTPIDWRGGYYSHPNNPKLNWAYFNMSTNTSYIFDGSDWHVLAKSGEDGVQINWLGRLYNQPSYPNLYDAYYDRYSGTSFIYNGGGWDTLARGGNDGVDGVSIVWKGNYTSDPISPELNWVYYNTVEGITYIYNGIGWEIFAKDGEDGYIAQDIATVIRGVVASGDSLILNHNYDSDTLMFLGQYIVDGNRVHNYSEIDPSWQNPYVLKMKQDLYSSSADEQPRSILGLSDGTLLNIFVESEGVYKGGKYASLTTDGVMGEIKTFTSSLIADANAVELTGGVLVFGYCNIDADSSAEVTFVDGNDKSVVTVHDTTARNLRIEKYNDTTAILAYINEENKGAYRTVTKSGVVSDETIFAETIQHSNTRSFAFTVQSSGEIMFVYQGTDITLAQFSDENVLLSEQSIVATNLILFDDIVELDNGSLYVGTRYSDGSEDLKQTIYQFSSTGVYLSHSEMPSFTATAQLAKLNGSKLMLIYVQNDHYANNDVNSAYIVGAPQVVILNDDLTIHSSNQIDDQIFQPAFFVNSDQTVSFTYVEKGNESQVGYGLLEVTDVNPVIELRTIDLDNTCLINKTGRTLEMTLSVYMHRSENPNAVRAQY